MTLILATVDEGSTPSASTILIKRNKKMYVEPIVAMSLAIFLSVTMFFMLYLTAYVIVTGAFYTTKKIKLKIKQDDKDNL